MAGKLRPGNVHSAEDWEEVLLPEIERQQELGKEVVFRADAAFAKPEIYEALEECGVKYAIRLPANDNLLRDIEELLTRPVGRPSYKPIVWYKGFLFHAASWKTARRVVAKVEFHAGESFPRLGFIVTNLGTGSRAVVRFYKRSPILPSRVGRPTTGSDFREERGRGAAKGRKHRPKEGRLRPLEFSQEARMASSVARESTLHCKPD